jgi:predicted transcriptional regulator
MNKSTFALGDTEMEILNVVWELKTATVSQVHERILSARSVAYTTIMTIMQNLAKKGFLKVNKSGVSYVYQAAIDPADVRKNLLSHLMNKVFRGSPMALVQTLAESESLSDEERSALNDIIQKLD